MENFKHSGELGLAKYTLDEFMLCYPLLRDAHIAYMKKKGWLKWISKYEFIINPFEFESWYVDSLA